jgi:hypothetical protein
MTLAVFAALPQLMPGEGADAEMWTEATAA